MKIETFDFMAQLGWCIRRGYKVKMCKDSHGINLYTEKQVYEEMIFLLRL